MKKVLIGLAVGALGLVGLAPAAFATNEKVTICHRTNSDTNPYVLITVSVKAVDGEGKNDHTHHVVDDNHSRADIIPAPVDEETETPYCPGPEPVPGPEGPQGPAGPEGPEGPPGRDGMSPFVVCFPGLGLGYLYGEDTPSSEDVPDGGFLLGEGAICPLAGPTGPAGEDGVDGVQGPAGPQGAAGADGLTGPAGPQGPAGEITVETTPTPVPVGNPVDELPHTGAAEVLWIIGGSALAAGLAITAASWLARRRNGTVVE